METQETKLTEEEIQQVKVVQENRQKVINELGQIKLAELNLEKRLESAETTLEQLQQQEKELAKYMETKYGNGVIDIDTGEFTPS
jgi:hypothetical protein|tara:strand:+ start:329 stop:583 length:255 start_codon:yes stop_codon:yes gene_type:complete